MCGCKNVTGYLSVIYCNLVRLDIPTVSPIGQVRFYDIDGDFVIDLLKELVRAYSASPNTRSQVLLPLYI